MHCTIDADLKAPELVACQERHFGQITAGIQLMPYEVRMDRAEFIATCEPLYLEYVGYERNDEPFYRPGTDPVIDRWHLLRYPQLTVLLDKDAAVVEHLLRRRFGSSLLRRLFPMAHEGTRFVLNTLDVIQVEKGGVLLAGKAWAV